MAAIVKIQRIPMVQKAVTTNEWIYCRFAS